MRLSQATRNELREAIARFARADEPCGALAILQNGEVAF